MLIDIYIFKRLPFIPVFIFWGAIERSVVICFLKMEMFKPIYRFDYLNVLK